MIGRLLQSATSTFSQHSLSCPPIPLESVTEESHTRELLYPDGIALRTSQQIGASLNNGRPTANARDAASFDDRGELDISYPGDVRIIIAQNANSHHHQPQVLYDSKPPQSSSVSRTVNSWHELEVQNSSLTPLSEGREAQDPAPSTARRSHTPQSSLFLNSLNHPLTAPLPQSPDPKYRPTLGCESRSRASSFQPFANEPETAQGKLVREAKEETEALLGCMFGAPGFRIEPGTKIHLIPRKTADDQDNTGSKSPNLAAARPLSSSGYTRKRTPLVRSTSAANMSNEAFPTSEERRTSLNSKPSIMFTRLFSIHVPESSDDDLEEVRRSKQDGAFSSAPETNEGSSNTKFATNVKQIKVPMYVIAVLFQLPKESHQFRSRLVHANGLSSLGSSYNERAPETSWHIEHGLFPRLMDIPYSGSFPSVNSHLNNQVSQVLSHSNMINKCLDSLELVARQKLGEILEQAVPLVPLTSALRSKANIVKLKKPRLLTQHSVHVQPDCLQNCFFVHKEAVLIGQRIVSALRIRRVVTGQNRWGAWREEARWVGRWAGGRDQNFFFYTFLTAFLGSHTLWMDSVGPFGHKLRTAVQHAQCQEDLKLQPRTIIVSYDKMAARRLIFLLATFLPGARELPYFHSTYPSHPTLSYSESPPSILPQRVPSLRRALKTRSNRSRRGGPDQHILHTRSVSFSVRKAEGHTSADENPVSKGLFQPTSYTKSIWNESLCIPNCTGNIPKTSTSASVAESADPVAHFSSLSNQQSTMASAKRPSSSDSLASLALACTLKRSESSTGTTSSVGRWGSVVSGFWSNRRGSSTDESEALAPSHEHLADPRKYRDLPNKGLLKKLNCMVEEVTTLPVSEVSADATEASMGLLWSASNADCSKSKSQPLVEGGSAAKSIPEARFTRHVPLKMSMNEDEGYLDIEMPPVHSHTSSLASSFNSSRLHHTGGNNHEHYMPYGIMNGPESPREKSEQIVDVAGWLRRYHPDFCLQAVRPYDGLEDEVRDSMLAESRREPWGKVDSGFASLNDKWTDVCTTLLADTTNFSIQRLRLRRRRKVQSSQLQAAVSGTKRTSQIWRDPSFSDIEEEFVGEKVMDMDPTLVDAIDRVLGQSGHSSRVPSRAPSPSREEHRSLRGLQHSRAGSVHNFALDISALEVPHSECRQLVIGALEEVVRSVLTEQHNREAINSLIPKDIPERETRAKEMPDSTLREGVRRWLADVEDRYEKW